MNATATPQPRWRLVEGVILLAGESAVDLSLAFDHSAMPLDETEIGNLQRLVREANAASALLAALKAGFPFVREFASRSTVDGCREAIAAFEAQP